MEALTPGHLVVILIAFVLLAGYKKLPEASRSVGRLLRISAARCGTRPQAPVPGRPPDPLRSRPLSWPLGQPRTSTRRPPRKSATRRTCCPRTTSCVGPRTT
jgi:mttA/Hcf106 family